MLRRGPDDLAHGRQTARDGHRSNTTDQARYLSTSRRRGNHSPDLPKSSGHWAGILELALQPQRHGSVRTEGIRDHRPAGCGSCAAWWRGEPGRVGYSQTAAAALRQLAVVSEGRYSRRSSARWTVIA